MLVVCAGCSSGEAVTVVSENPQSPGSETTGDLLPPVAVIGDGRATQASSVTGVGGVVATTIGASVVGASAAAFTSDGATVVTSSPTNVSAAPVATSDSPRSLIDAPAGTDLGAVTMTPDGATVITPVSGDGADFITYSEATGAVPVDVFADPLKKIIRAELADDGQRLVFTTSTGDPFQAGLASWTPTAGVAWEIDAGPAGAGIAWATGSDGRVLLADESMLRLIGLDGAVVAEWPFDGPQSVTSVVATQTGYAVAYWNSTLLFTNLDGAPYGPAVPTGQPLIDLEPLASADGVVAVTLAGDVRHHHARQSAGTPRTSRPTRHSAVRRAVDLIPRHDPQRPMRPGSTRPNTNPPDQPTPPARPQSPTVTQEDKEEARRWIQAKLRHDGRDRRGRADRASRRAGALFATRSLDRSNETCG